jgi:hypothetical protein
MQAAGSTLSVVEKVLKRELQVDDFSRQAKKSPCIAAIMSSG